jgi:hypothetical protein
VAIIAVHRPLKIASVFAMPLQIGLGGYLAQIDAIVGYRRVSLPGPLDFKRLGNHFGEQ